MSEQKARVVDRAPGVDRVIIWNGTSEKFLSALANVAPYTVVYRYPIIDGVAVAVPHSAVDDVVRFSKSHGLKAKPDYKVHSLLDTSTKPIHVKNTTPGSGAWSMGYTGQGVSIAMIDTGIDAAHQSLNDQDGIGSSAPKVVAFKDFVGTSSTSYDDNGHGSHTAGIAGGTGQGSSGDGPNNHAYVGVAYGASLVGIKVLDSNGTGSGSDIIAGIQWADANRNTVSPPIKVMSMSFGSATSGNGTDPEDQAIDVATSHGITSAVALGNGSDVEGVPNSTIKVSIPGDAITAITVGSSQHASQTASNWDSVGPTQDNRTKPDVIAPGEGVVSVRNGSNESSYVSNGGTSMSTPHVAGIAALLYQAVPGLTAEQVKQSITQTASHAGSGQNNDDGWGSAQAKEAIQYAITNFGGPDNTPPSQVTGLRAVPGNAAVTLLWNAATDNRAVDHYKVYVNSVFSTTAFGTSTTVSGLTNGTAYNFAVSAVDIAGNEGTLSALLNATPAPPSTVNWPQFHNDNGLRALASGSSTMVTSPPVLQTLQPGGALVSSPLIVDLNGDGRNDVVAVSNATQQGQSITVNAYTQNASGSLQPSWSYAVPNDIGSVSTQGIGSIAAGDLNQDGTPEVVVYYNYATNLQAATSNIGGLAVVNGASGVQKAILGPGPIGIGLPVHPVIGDVTGDGVPDIVFVYQRGTNQNTPGRYLMGYDFSGASLSQLFDTFISTSAIVTAPALADLRPSSLHSGLEAVVATDTSASTVYVCSPAAGSANCNKTLAPASPNAISFAHGIAIADLDGANGPDIVVNGEDANALTILKFTGDALVRAAGLADGFYYNTPTLADVTGDGKPDIVNVSESNLRNEIDPVLAGDVKVRSWNGGASMSQTGTYARPSGTPGTSAGSAGGGALADLLAGDGGRPEFVFGADDGSVVAVKFSAIGAPSLLWSMPVATAPFSPPAIADVTSDGKVDIVIGTADGKLDVIGIAGPPVSVPGAPTGLNATRGNGSVALSWIAPVSDGGSPITSYKIYRGTSSGNETLLTSQATIGFTDTAVTNGTTYFYKVAAVNSVGEGAQSLEASATPATVPSAPGSLDAIAGDAHIDLSWSAPASNGGSAITGFKVFRGTTSNGQNAVPIATPVGTSLSDTGVSNGTTYYYKVSASNDVGDGPQSSEASATPTIAVTAPSAPTGLAGTEGNAQVSLSWNIPLSNGGAALTAYKIYRGTSSGAESFLTQRAADGTTLVDDTAVNGGTYFYTVSAVNTAGESPQSNEVTASPATLPGAPLSVSATAGDGRVSLSWGAPASDGGRAIGGYKIYRGTTSGGEGPTPVATSVGTSYSDTSLVNGTTYYFTVTAVNAIGEGTHSAETAATPARVAIPIFRTPSAGAFLSSTHVDVSGTAATDSIVHIYEAGSEVGNATAGAGDSFTTSITFAEGAHTITAIASDSAGNVSDTSGARSFTIDTHVPGAPVIGSPAEGATLSDARVVIGGTAEPGSMISVDEGPLYLGGVRAGSGGGWSLTAHLANGSHTITAIATSRSGISSAASAGRTFSLGDTVAPAVPTITSPSQGTTLNSSAVEIAGATEPGAIVTVEEQGSPLRSATADPAGKYSAFIWFAEGSHTVLTRAADGAGNASASSVARSFTVRLASPEPSEPAITSPAEGSLQRRNVNLTGNAQPGMTVEISSASGVIGTAHAAPNGAWTLSIDLTDGAQHIIAVAIDGSARRSHPSAMRSFEVDGTPPAASISTRSGSVFFGSFTITGAATDERGVASVEVRYFDNRGIRVATDTAECSGCGAGGTSVGWSSSPSLDSGYYTAQVNSVDRAGNRSAGRTITFWTI